MSTDFHWPCIAWQVLPRGASPAGMAHATPTGRDIALCGAHTPYLADPWPRPGEHWTHSCSRCPACAHRLYSTRRP